jgi:hypothetical protein
MTEQNTKKRPTHAIWQVIGEKEKSRWTRVGIAFTNRDGKGLLLAFDAFPVTGRTILREIGEKPPVQPTDDAAQA